MTICQTSDIYLEFQEITFNFISNALTKSLDFSYLYLSNFWNAGLKRNYRYTWLQDREAFLDLRQNLYSLDVSWLKQ